MAATMLAGEAHNDSLFAGDGMSWTAEPGSTIEERANRWLIECGRPRAGARPTTAVLR